jgi:hypothetical protein
MLLKQEPIKTKSNTLEECFEQDEGVSICDDSMDGKFKRKMALVRLVLGPPGVAEMIRLVGCHDEDVGKGKPSALYMQVQRAQKKIIEAPSVQEVSVHQDSPLIHFPVRQAVPIQASPVLNVLAGPRSGSGGEASFSPPSASDGGPLLALSSDSSSSGLARFQP